MDSELIACEVSERCTPPSSQSLRIPLGHGSIIMREYVTPKAILETTGGDSSTGEFKVPPSAQLGAVFTPLPRLACPPRTKSSFRIHRNSSRRDITECIQSDAL
jgi:hypothetical protein